MEDHVGKKYRNIQKENRGACRKEMEEGGTHRKEIYGHAERKSRNMQKGTGGERIVGTCKKGRKEEVGKTVKGGRMHCL
jgi:hypothetical protein